MNGLPFVDHEDAADAHVGAIVDLLKGNDRPIAVVRVCTVASLAAGIELPFTWLRSRLGLTETEDRVLWLLVAHELSLEARQLLREMASEQVLEPTFDVIRRVVYGPRPTLASWRELGPEGRLRTLGLVERTDGGAEVAEQRQTFKVARRVLALVHGDTRIDPALAGIARLAPPPRAVDELAIDHDALARLRDAVGTPQLVVAHGRSGSGRRSVLSALADAPILEVDARAIASDRERAAAQLRAIAREACLLARTPLVVHVEALAANGDAAGRLDLIEQHVPGRVLATSTHAIARRWRRPIAQVELPALSGARTAELWRRALPQASAADAELLATLYPLAPALVDAAGASARATCGDGAMQPRHVEAGIRTVLDDRLAGLATRVDVTQSWDDLVLPDDQITAIVELLARIRERRRVYEDWGFARKLGKGLGVSALFSGPPGTGKTMAAALVARDLGVELYRVDLANIASKWIGETEKNLATLFDAAEAGCAILLFDEADALFGKRTDVKSSNDRHANAQTNYLLQRLETFTGVCLLTTNHESGLDDAFRRRLSIHVRFPVPDADERARLWRALLPADAPVAPDLTIERLADTFAMSGGYIRNAVLRAAFLAADEGSPIAAEHLQRAARLEYEAMGKVVAA